MQYTFYKESVRIIESLFLKGKFETYAEKHFLANITTIHNNICQTKIPSKIAMSEKKLVTVDYHEQKILSTAVHPTKQSRVGWEIM